MNKKNPIVTDEIGINTKDGKEIIPIEAKIDDQLLDLLAKTDARMEIGLETNFVISIADCGLVEKDGRKIFSMSRRIWTSMEVDIKNRDESVRALDGWQNKKLKEWSDELGKSISKKKREKMDKGYIEQ